MIVGLTGGIGSGKTAASDAFAARGITVVDADVIARGLLAPGTPLSQQVINHFGQSIAAAAGVIDRAALRQRVFNDPQARQWLESQTHPRVREAILQALQESQSAYTLLASPLLIESGQDKLVDRIIVVDVPESVQRSRTIQRDGNSEAQVDRIMASQCHRSARLAKADDVIDNQGDLIQLEAQVEQLHQYYLQHQRHLQNS